MAPHGWQADVQSLIDETLDGVKDPESGLSIADLGLVRRVRVSDQGRIVYLDVPFDNHTPGCLACAGIAMTIVLGIRRDLKAAFEKAFPGYAVEFI